MKKKQLELLKILALYTIGFGLLGWMIASNWNSKVEGKPGLKDLLSRPIRYDYLALTALLMTMTLSLQIVRWFFLVRALDLPFTLRSAFRLGLVGYFFSQFLPSSIGGDAVKAFVIAKEQPERRAAAVATVIIDRAMGLFGLLLFASVAGGVAWASGNEQIASIPTLQNLIKFSAAFAGAMMLGYVLLGLLPAHRADRFAGRLKHIPKVGYGLAESWYAVWVYRQRVKIVLLGVCISAAAHFAMILAFYFASRSFTADNPAGLATLPEIMVIAPIGFIVQAVPLSPGGVGLAEFFFEQLYNWIGRNGNDGLAARLALRVVEWSLGFIGYLVYLRKKKELTSAQAAAEKEAALHGGHMVDPPMGDDGIAGK